MGIDKEVLDKLLADYKGPEDLIGEQGLLKQLTKALVERAMQAELTHHLGYEKHDPAGRGSGNARNGTSKKKIKGDFGNAQIEVPRDRNGTFEPKIIPPHKRRFTGFDDKILSMYARGMTTRDIQGHLKEIYGVDVAASLITHWKAALNRFTILWEDRIRKATYA
jgi:putative transposase